MAVLVCAAMKVAWLTLPGVHPRFPDGFEDHLLEMLAGGQRQPNNQSGMPCACWMCSTHIIMPGVRGKCCMVCTCRCVLQEATSLLHETMPRAAGGLPSAFD